MKVITTAIIGLLLVTKPAHSQYCMLTGQTPYSNLQPGITNFKLNTINRTSVNSESGTSVVVNTGLSTTLTAGQTYTISISHSEDPTFFAGDRNNLRIWVDYNNNFSYTDAGETALSVNLQPPGTTYTGAITIPVSLATGTYALRVTAKMSVDAGHSLPTPCNVPADQLGYHGEMEDYILYIQSAPPQSPAASFALSSTVCAKAALTTTNNSTGVPVPTYSWSSNPASGVTFTPSSTASTPTVNFAVAGNYTITCSATNTLASDSFTRAVSAKACDVGLSETDATEQFNMWPSPANKELTIQFINPQNRAQISILNNLGQLVLQKQTVLADQDRIRMDVSKLENGIYYISISSDTKTANKQLIINR